MGKDALVPGTHYEDILRTAYRAGSLAGTTLTEDGFVSQRLAQFRNPGDPIEHPMGDRWIQINDRRTRNGEYVSLRTDITALKRAREEAEAASLAKGEFLANMSHEIRTPMNGVLGLTELLLESELTREQRESLTLVWSSANALLTVINDILDFSKIEAGKLDLDPAPFQLGDTLGDTLNSLAVKAHEKGLELACDIRPGVPDTLIGDAGRIRQVVTNLVGNAIKFTETGEVVVRAERIPEEGKGIRIRFTVRDTGIGITKAKHAKIFDAFSQADGSTTRRYGGTGLGLTISARLVELMGGRIWVESEPGRGSEFHFEACFEPANGSAICLSGRPPTPLRDAAVLVVDDNSTNRRVLEETLRLWGARSTCVDSGPAAVAELRRAATAGELYALVLLDAMMPDMDGFTVAEQIAREPELAGQAIMMLTSADRQGDAARCRSLGVLAHLVKPVKAVDLHRAITAALRDNTASDPRSDAAFPSGVVGQEVGPATRPLRILLAEDNVVNQRVAIRLLEKFGHSVTVANHGGEALAWFNRERFELILMDVQMPEMDGFETTLRIREVEAGGGRRTPIVAMTAHAMKGDRERCLSGGMDDYLSKPVQRDDLLRVLAWVAGTPAEPREVETSKDSQDAITKLSFDREAALKRLGGDAELFDELITLFRTDGPRSVEEIRGALAAGNAAGVRSAAHGLKGAAGYLGGTATVDAAHKLELIGTSGDLTTAPEVLSTLTAELTRLMADLDSFQPHVTTP